MPGPNAVRNVLSPISLEEFSTALYNAWLPASPPARVGIAVSGGVDSMVLSKLCVSLRGRWENRSKPDFHAFVVDHKARVGSGEEAQLTASRLQNLGLKSTVLSLKWSDGVKPAELANFETQARRLRYRALGVACRNLSIRALLLAHHGNDVAESMLLRIMHIGHSPATWSLRVMKPGGSHIPECWGVHGVHRSGHYQAESSLQNESHNGIASQAGDGLPARACRHIGFEDGGVKIYRPLLGFTKTRIQATSREQGLEWVEDETNHDVKRTTRNAIRSLLNAQRLPKALSMDNLRAIDEKAKTRLLSIENRAEKLFQRADFLVFDVRSGGLVVRLPRLHLGQDDLGAMVFLKRIFEMISPKPRISVSSMDTALYHMSCKDPSTCGGSEKQEMKHLHFCSGGVFAQREEMPAQPHLDVSASAKLDPDYIWILTREAFPESKAPSTIRIPATDLTNLPHSHEALARNENRNGVSDDQLRPFRSWSSWELWDGRFWIRVSNLTRQHLEVRAFLKQDRSFLDSKLTKTERRSLRRALEVAAPGPTRWTLPVIADLSNTGKIFAFPTLGNVIDSLAEGLDWEVRFRHVDFGTKQLEEGRTAR